MPFVANPDGSKRYVLPNAGNKASTPVAPKKRGDLDLEGLAASSGVSLPKHEPSFLENIFDVLSRGQYASANAAKVLTGKSSDDIGSAIRKGLTGEQKGSYSDPEFGGDKLLGFVGDVLLDPTTYIPGGAVLKAGVKGAKLVPGATKAGEVASKLASPVTDVAAPLFKPFARTEKVSPKLAGSLKQVMRELNAGPAEATEQVAGLAKKIPTELQNDLAKMVEGTGTRSVPQGTARTLKRFISKEISGPERALRIAPDQVANYFPRKAEAREVMNFFQAKKLTTSLSGAQESRKYATKAAGEAAGVNYKPDLDALAMRLAASKRAVTVKRFFNDLPNFKTDDGEFVFKPVKAGKLLEGHVELGIKDLRGLQAPVEVAKDIESYYKTFMQPEEIKGLLKFYDTATNVWKASVTSIHPAFHGRNAIGNLFNMYLGGFKDPRRLIQAAAIQKGKAPVINGVRVTTELLRQHAIAGTGQFGADIPDLLATAMKKRKVTPGKVAGAPFAAGRAVGTAVEDNAKIAFFIDRLAKGDTAEQAAALTRRYLFDYNELTPFERNILRRAIPFYTWARKNIPLQIQEVIKQPGKYAAVAKGVRALDQGTDEQRENLPSFSKEGINLITGPTGEDDMFRVLTSLGLPLEDLGRLNRGDVKRTVERELLGSLNPILKGALQLQQGKDFFRGKNLDELSGTYGYAARNFPQPLKDFLEFKEERITPKSGEPFTRYTVNPTKYLLLQESPLSRVTRSGSDAVAGDLEKVLLPFRNYEFSLGDEKEKRDRERRKALEKLLEEAGVLKQFKRYYKPKEAK